MTKGYWIGVVMLSAGLFCGSVAVDAAQGTSSGEEGFEELRSLSSQRGEHHQTRRHSRQEGSGQGRHPDPCGYRQEDEKPGSGDDEIRCENDP